MLDWLDWGNVPEWVGVVVSAAGVVVTAVAAVAAVVAARRAGAAAKSAADAVIEAEKSTEEARAMSRAAADSLALERTRDADRERADEARQAEQVAAWLVTEREPKQQDNPHGDPGEIWVGNAELVVRNASEQPIHDVVLAVWSNDRPIRTKRDRVRTLAPGFTVNVPVLPFSDPAVGWNPARLERAVRVPHDFDALRYAVAFRDGSSRRWVRGVDGVLHRVQEKTASDALTAMYGAFQEDYIEPWEGYF